MQATSLRPVYRSFRSRNDPQPECRRKRFCREGFSATVVALPLAFSAAPCRRAIAVTARNGGWPSVFVPLPAELLRYS